jgi:hypothetical protein
MLLPASFFRLFIIIGPIQGASLSHPYVIRDKVTDRLRIEEIWEEIERRWLPGLYEGLMRRKERWWTSSGERPASMARS